MSVPAIKTWLYEVLTAAVNPALEVYPRPGAAGILDAAGWGAAQVTIVKNRPPFSIDVQTRAAITINVDNEAETQITSGGPQGTRGNTLDIVLEVMWAADFTGDPKNNIPPKYTNNEIPQGEFEKLVEAVKEVLRLSTTIVEAAGETFKPASKTIDDPVIAGRKVIIRAKAPDINTDWRDNQNTENSQNPFYLAFVHCQFIQDLIRS